MSKSITLDELRRSESGGSPVCILDVSSAIVGSKLVLPIDLWLYESLRNTRHLTITGKGVGSITEIGDGFLKDCSNLKTIDFKQHINITRIGNNFLFECGSLTSIDLSSLGFMDETGSKFLADNLNNLPSSVRHLQCVNGSCCTTIGDDFLKQIPSLTTVDLSSLNNVTQVGDWFLGYGCKFSFRGASH
eukprot:TRINITY_DN313_c1_g1_i5.p1 TRINITY_DN313_c1_g1~~TRINITY_DN313_c1_g1_i5.p1  ORF type:complete len:189 (+),score=19.63 TRINITY_DN313_c1_g1_i5:39-605(+)